MSKALLQTPTHPPTPVLTLTVWVKRNKSNSNGSKEMVRGRKPYMGLLVSRSLDTTGTQLPFNAVPRENEK